MKIKQLLNPPYTLNFCLCYRQCQNEDDAAGRGKMSITGCTFQLKTVRRDTEPYKREIVGLEKTVVGLDHTRSNIFVKMKMVSGNRWMTLQ